MISALKKNVSVAHIKPRTAGFMFVFLLALPTKLQERLVCLFLWVFNCSLCKLSYARNSMWTFYLNKYLVSVPAPLVASVSFPQGGNRSGKITHFWYSKISGVKNFRNSNSVNSTEKPPEATLLPRPHQWTAYALFQKYLYPLSFFILSPLTITK